MNNKYQIELDEFNDNFEEFKQSRIVLYGIGRYTATLVEGLKDFKFVGLMDKDPANIGKVMFGLPIVSQAEAEEKADLVIINTSETYWDVIYNRIEDIKIPVYYKNGKRAEKLLSQTYENPYKDLSWEELESKIQNAEVISFDFFDTLFVRNVCNPRDVFNLLEDEIREDWKIKSSFSEERNKAIECIEKNYSLDELYEKIEENTGLSHEIVEKIKAKEICLEQKILMPRNIVLELFSQCLNDGKEVYLISDMYLPKQFYGDVLDKYGIEIEKKYILLSNELGMSKIEGNLWEYYNQYKVRDRKALHIGDNKKADVTMPKSCGIDSYLVPSVWDMLTISSLGRIKSDISTKYDSVIAALILNRLFENPYVFERKEGKIEINTNEDMGYVVFGPVILNFLLWLMYCIEREKKEKLVFMSRDGYFLKEDFDYICELMNKKKDSCYIGISRQLAMMASIEDEVSLLEYMTMPYSGTIVELFEDRLGIEITEEICGKSLQEYIEQYKDKIWKRIKEVRSNYLAYLQKENLQNVCAVVDLGYYGNNQRYLNKLLDLNMCGYYFNVNTSEKNINTKYQNMQGCFQTQDDLTGENSQILKNMIFIESFLTAPYGMVKEIDSEGNFICAAKKKNQECFEEKVELNRGVKQYIADFVKNFGDIKLRPEYRFVDKYYGLCIKQALKFSDEVKHSFYNDNAMMNRIESMLFY